MTYPSLPIITTEERAADRSERARWLLAERRLTHLGCGKLEFCNGNGVRTHVTIEDIVPSWPGIWQTLVFRDPETGAILHKGEPMWRSDFLNWLAHADAKVIGRRPWRGCPMGRTAFREKNRAFLAGQGPNPAVANDKDRQSGRAVGGR